MTCPQCSKQNSAEDRFCMECGKALEEQPVEQSTPGSPVEDPSVQAPAAEAESPPVVEELPAYRPSGRCPVGAFPVLLLAALLGGTLLGGLYHLVGRFLDVPLLFAVLAGMGAGGVVALAVLAGRCRNPAVAFIFGLLAGLLMYGARTTFDAYELRPLMVTALTRLVIGGGSTPPDEARRSVERVLGPWRTVKQFLQFQSRVGVTITSGYSPTSKGTPLKGNWFWLLFATEMGLAGLVGGLAARESARKPYCENCRQWLNPQVLFKGNPGLTQAVLDAVRVRDWEGLAALARGQFNDQNHCDAIVIRCAGCEDATVAVETTSGGKKRQLFRGRLTPEDIERLVKRET